METSSISTKLLTGSGPHCMYKKCSGLKIKKKIIRPHQTKYRCEECSIDKETDFGLCNTIKVIGGKNKTVNCHMRYHADMCLETESAVDSELTEE
jgi:hypothetical protein